MTGGCIFGAQLGTSRRWFNFGIKTSRGAVKAGYSAATPCHMRSDPPFDAVQFDRIILGEATAARLERASELRAQGVISAHTIADSGY